MENNNLAAVMEAVLFASGEPLDIEKASKALLVDKETIENVLSSIREKYNSDEHGIELLNLGGKYQFATKSKFAPQIRAVLSIKKNTQHKEKYSAFCGGFRGAGGRRVQSARYESVYRAGKGSRLLGRYINSLPKKFN